MADEIQYNTFNADLYKLAEDYSYDEIMSVLSSDNADNFLKVFSILSISSLKTHSDAKLFINHLTNRPNPIREVCALKLNEIIDSCADYFSDNFSKEKILNAITDINPNVSRSICDTLSKNPKLKSLLQKDIIQKINLELNNIKQYEKTHKEDFSDSKKNHAKNKKLFALYWLLEALFICMDNKFESEIVEILKYTIKFYDYTIREKTAQILNKLPDAPDELLAFVKCDQNFYVKNQVYDKINFED